jgi:hypothetical protein
MRVHTWRLRRQRQAGILKCHFRVFPGGRPGQPIGGDRLGIRLQNIGLHPRQARSTALFALAAEIPAEIPAEILARMLGIHVQVAVQWQRASAGDWMAYRDRLAALPDHQDLRINTYGPYRNRTSVGLLD